MDTEINKLVSNLHNRVYNLKVLTEFTDTNTRLTFTNSFILGKLNYMLPTYSNLTTFNINKLHKLLMTAARTVVGNYCYKKSCKYILDKCKWLCVNDMIKYRGLTFIHKILTHKLPISLFTMFKVSKYSRAGSKISLQNIPENIKYINFFINKYIKQYNLLDGKLKSKSIKQFKKEIKLEIPNQNSDTMD